MPRKGISKKARFEVFKRDSFQCQYCGANAPDVLLQVDHIKPVAKGGTNELSNLITSCQPCNSGKSDIELSDKTVVKKQKAQLDQLNQRREQINMMMKWHEGLKDINVDMIDRLVEYWDELAYGFTVNAKGRSKLAKWLKSYKLEEILSAMDCAAAQYLEFGDDGEMVTNESWAVAWGKIPAIIVIARREKENPEIKEIYYIRGILRNRLSYFDPYKALEWLEIAREWGATLQELKSIALQTRNWTTFSEDIDVLIEKYSALNG